MASQALVVQSAPARSRRIPGLDALRGLFLVLMTVTHLPTRWSVYSHDAFGFVSAAEGFVFLSAFLVAHIYSPALEERGERYVKKVLWRRAFVLYGAHLGLLFSAFSLAIYFSHRPALYNVLSFFVDEPARALLAAPLLVYKPPLFDILPLYAIFLAVTPYALSLVRRRGLSAMLVPSLLLWVLGQFGARKYGQAFVIWVFGGVPDHIFGAFDVFSWQLLWCLGLTLGSSPGLQERLASPPRRTLVAGAGALCVAFFALRYGERLFGISLGIPVLFDKWQLGPMRLLNLVAWLVVLVQLGPRLVRGVVAQALRLLGRASLSVFCAHVLIALGAFLLIDDADSGLELWQELLVLTGGFALLFGVAHSQTGNRAIA